MSETHFTELTAEDDTLIMEAIMGERATNPLRTFTKVKEIIDNVIDQQQLPVRKHSPITYANRYHYHLKFTIDKGDFDPNHCLASTVPWRLEELAQLQNLIPATMPGGRYEGDDHFLDNTRPSWTRIGQAMKEHLQDPNPTRYAARNCAAAYRARILPDFNAREALNQIQLPAGTPPVLPAGPEDEPSPARVPLENALQQANQRYFVDYGFVLGEGWNTLTTNGLDVAGLIFDDFIQRTINGPDESSTSESGEDLQPEEQIMEF